MSLSQEQIDWITKAAGAVPKIEQSLDVETLKAKMLKAARDKIDQNVGAIHVGEDFDVETMSGFLNKKVTMASIGEDPNEDFDTGHDSGKMTKGLGGKDFALLMQAQSVIATEVETLRREPNPQTKKPLFTDKEISDAIWQPLKRRKFIAENAIPDRYSDVSRTFSGASGEYEMRLSAYTDSLKGNEGTLKALGIAKDVIDTAGSMAGAVLTDLGSVGKLVDSYQAVTICKGVQTTLSAGMTISQSIVKEGGINKNNCEAIGKDLVKAAQTLVNASFAGDSWNEVNLGKSIAYAVGAAASGPAIYAKIKNKKYGEILDDIGDLVQAGLTSLTYEVKSTGASDEGPGGTGVMQWNEVGTTIAGAIKTGRVALETLFSDHEPTPEEILKILQTAIKAGIDAGSSYTFDHEKKSVETTATDSSHDNTSTKTDNTEQDPNSPDLEMARGVIELEWQALRDAGPTSPGLTAPEKLLKEVMAKGPEALKKLKKDDPAYKSLAKMAEVLDKQNKLIQQQELATFDQEMQESEKSFRDMLNRSESGDSEKDVEQIEALILQMKKDQMIVDLAMQLVSLPAQAVAAFLPQLGMVPASIELVKNITKAALHFKAYAEWAENVRDAKSAMSVQVEAMTNRMDWSGKKGADEVLSALENAAKIVGSAVSYAGPFAPVGHIVTATVVGVSALRNLITKYVREAELKDAWKLYKSARNNPDDRKTIRASIRKNPTLAKYVIAWGAEVEGDPVAKSAMKKCGLTEDVLSNKNSNVQKVVTFLETMYPDDPILLEPSERATWYPGKVEFTGASFATFVGAAEKDANPKLKKGAASSLLKEFTRFDIYKETCSKAHKDWETATADAQKTPLPPGAIDAEEKAEDALRAALDASLRSGRFLLATLKTFKPPAENDQPHAEFVAYCGSLMPTARAFVTKYQRETEALTVTEDEGE